MRRVLAVVALTSAAIAVAPASGATAAQRRDPLAVVAFQPDYSSPKLIDESKQAITTVGVDGVSLTHSGASVTSPSSGAADNLRRAHHDHLRAELLVSNYSNKVNDFSEPLAYGMLASKQNIDAVAGRLVADVRHGGWDGISLDLESLHPRDADGLSQFARELRNRLPKHATLSICVMSATHPHQYYAEWGYRLAQLAGIVDRVELMTYDEHGPWEDKPGPIGALDWQRRSVAAARHYVPKNKMDLGVAGYGYAWGTPDGNEQLTVRQARNLAGGRGHFDKTVGEWTAKLPDGSVLWWSDVRSYKLRAALAKQLGLHGLAMWALSSSDPLPA
jgi:spore germination protein YaaH